MPQDEKPGSKKTSSPEGNESPGGPHRLLRYCHIFSAAVREVLESQLIQEISPEPLTISQFHLLKLMTFNGQHQVGQAADFLGVSPPAATKNIDKLEGIGLLVRSPDKGDRRATLLSVTPKGRRLVRKYEEIKAERLEPILHHFGKKEIDHFSTMLERFAVSLLSLKPSGEGFCLRCAAYLEPNCPVGRIRGGCPHQKGKTKARHQGVTPEVQ